MRLVPIFTTGKKAEYENLVSNGQEGIMLKKTSGRYIQKGRPDCMQKVKRFEEVDAFVSGFEPGDAESGWYGLVGSLILSCYTETNQPHEVAKCSNLELTDRIKCSVCAACGGELDVRHDNVDGKRVVLGITCKQCKADRPTPALAKNWYNRVFEVRGQEFTARVYRLKHAAMIRERVGVDGKSPRECTINLKDVQKRFMQTQRAEDLG